MSRKVILLGPLPPPFGGVSVYMSLLLEHLKPRGVGAWAYFGDAFADDPAVRRFHHRRLGIIPVALREGRGARVLDATHFHLEYPHPLLLPVWLVLKKLLGFCWYKNVHDGSLPARYSDFTLLQRTLFHLALRRVDKFIVVGDDLRRWLIEELDVRQKVTVIPCLLPIPARQTEGELYPTTEAALGQYLRRARRVCSAGAFIPDYGFLDAARAVERVREETGEDVGLALLDGAFARDDAYRAEVLAGREWITVLENVPHADVYKVMRRSDVFIRAVTREGYGISRVEALWCGLPVVATHVGETRGMLTFEFGDVSALARHLRHALQDPPREEIKIWAETFRREAEENLKKLMQALRLE